MLPLSLLAAISLVATTSLPPPEPDARALFLANCASCHGSNGDGNGTTKLDRPARSFKAGGFSYGNTEEALLRSITHGIPGTPMPSFETSLSAEDRRALASYVITLGPPVEVATIEETVLTVGTRPLVVRGYLPPIGAEAIEHPRGLLIGHPSGLTFEYRVDDVRLLGIRTGSFVERKDWIGRGGSALSPAGKVVRLFDAGNPPPLFRDAAGALRAKLRRTDVLDRNIQLSYDVLSADGERRARVQEVVEPTAIPGTAGIVRKLALSIEGEPFRVRIASFKGRVLERTIVNGESRRWFITRGENGLEALGLRTFQAENHTIENDVLWLDLIPAPSQVDIVFLSLPELNDDVEAALMHDMNR